jgi:hypothetical protein
MEWNTTWEDPLTSYVKQFDGLIGDRRTRKTFGETVKGIIAAGSLICQQIAAQVELATCPLRVGYWTNVRRQGQGQVVTREVWLVQVRVLGVDWDPWLLLTDWPVTDAPNAVRIFTMYRERQERGR